MVRRAKTLLRLRRCPYDGDYGCVHDDGTWGRNADLFRKKHGLSATETLTLARVRELRGRRL